MDNVIFKRFRMFPKYRPLGKVGDPPEPRPIYIDDKGDILTPSDSGYFCGVSFTTYAPICNFNDLVAD